MTRVCSILPAVLAAILASCARVQDDASAAPAGSAAPTVTSVDPAPGPADASARFTVSFSAKMDEGTLLASRGGSETVVLAPEATVERAAAAIARSRVTVEERKLFVAATAELGADLTTLVLTPQAALAGGTYYLLVSPRLKDVDGRKLKGNGARFQYVVAGAAAAPAQLVAPSAGATVPLNLSRVFVHGEAGAVSVVDAQDAVIGGPLAVQGDAALAVSALAASSTYRLAVDGVAEADAAFTASSCPRAAPVSMQGTARLFAAEHTVEAEFRLDGPAEVEAQVFTGATCAADCRTAKTIVACAPDPCAPATFSCDGALRIEGLEAATAYSIELVIRDLQGVDSRSAPQPFETVASVPPLILSEVMASPDGPSPRSRGEYVEILNLGPGAARIDGLALIGPDGKARPLAGTPPPTPVVLGASERALAVGATFDETRYPLLPATTPVLRASTHRLLATGLHHAVVPSFRLVIPTAVPVELASFPGGASDCPLGTSLQRDESASDAAATWRCGRSGGTPGLPP